MATETVLQRIISFIFGHKYYANIINPRGTEECDLSSFIFRSKEDAMKHRNGLISNRSFMYIETVSFRSHRDY